MAWAAGPSESSTYRVAGRRRRPPTSSPRPVPELRAWCSSPEPRLPEGGADWMRVLGRDAGDGAGLVGLGFLGLAGRLGVGERAREGHRRAEIRTLVVDAAIGLVRLVGGLGLVGRIDAVRPV